MVATAVTSNVTSSIFRTVGGAASELVAAATRNTPTPAVYCRCWGWVWSGTEWVWQLKPAEQPQPQQQQQQQVQSPAAPAAVAPVELAGSSQTNPCQRHSAPDGQSYWDVMVAQPGAARRQHVQHARVLRTVGGGVALAVCALVLAGGEGAPAATKMDTANDAMASGRAGSASPLFAHRVWLLVYARGVATHAARVVVALLEDMKQKVSIDPMDTVSVLLSHP